MSKGEQFVQGSREWHKWRKRCREDLWFLNAKILGHEAVIPMTALAHLGLCRFASRDTRFEEVDAKRVQLIQVARGWGKSTLVTKGRTIQRLLRNQDWAAGIANERADNAKAFLDGIKQEFMHNEALKALFPELIPDFKKTKWAADRIMIQRSRTGTNPVNPSVLAAGRDTAVTGVHLNEWIIDDIISDDFAESALNSDAEMRKVERWIDRLQFLLVKFKDDPITFIGTPWFPGDCYEYVRNKYGWGEEPKKIRWTLEHESGDVQEILLETMGELAVFRLLPMEHGRAIFPEHLSMEDMQQIQRDDPITYASQILLEPTAGGVANFNKDWLRPFEWEGKRQIRYKDDEERVQFERTADMTVIMSVDPAISEKSTSARSAIVICGSNGSRIFMLEAWAKRCAPTVLALKIIDFFKEYRPTRVLIEGVAYQMALAEILNLLAEQHNLGQIPIFEFKTGTQQRKITRIAGLEPFFRKGLIYYHPNQTEFFNEYVHFSADIGSRLVDTLDALSFQKESWDRLAFLGDPQEESGAGKWKEAQARRLAKIRAHASRRTKEYRR